MFPTRIISDGSLRTAEDSFSFETRMPWYRALPLSSVTGIELAVDGQAVDPDAIAFEVNGTRYALDDLSARYDEWWYVTDGAELHVDRPGGLEPGLHELELTLGVHIPYIVHHGRALVVTEHCVKSIEVSVRVSA